MEKISAVLGVVRHVLTFAGGALVALGLTTSVDWSSALTNFDAVTGGAIALVGVVASILNKVKGFDWKNIFSGGAGA